MDDNNDHGVTETDNVVGPARRNSIVSVLSDPNAGIVASKKTISAEVADFVPSKRYDFRFSRKQILDLKRGTYFSK